MLFVRAIWPTTAVEFGKYTQVLFNVGGGGVCVVEYVVSSNEEKNVGEGGG